MNALPKIFVFCNSCEPQWHSMCGIAEDGTVLAGHLCSAHGYAAHDMGVNEDGWKRDLYAQHYPDGFEVVYCELKSAADIAKHTGLAVAIERNKAKQATS